MKNALHIANEESALLIFVFSVGRVVNGHLSLTFKFIFLYDQKARKTFKPGNWLISCEEYMIFSNQKIMIYHVKSLRFSFVALMDFSVNKINIVWTLDIPPRYNVFPKGFHYKVLKKHMNKNLILEEALLALWRSFVFIYKERDWLVWCYENFKLKASLTWFPRWP